MPEHRLVHHRTFQRNGTLLSQAKTLKNSTKDAIFLRSLECEAQYSAVMDMTIAFGDDSALPAYFSMELSAAFHMIF